MRSTDILIVGAGPAGMTAAISAARQGARVCLVEHGPEPGKKILSTGNGHCNLTNVQMGPDFYHTSDPAFVQTVLELFSRDQTLEFLQSLGIWTFEKNGFVYPRSEAAKTVREAFCLALSEAKVSLFTETNVTGLRPEKRGFQLRTDHGDFLARKLIFAPGGLAAPKTGSDGSAYIWIKSLGHQVDQMLPALVQLHSDSTFCRETDGVRVQAQLKLWVNGKEWESQTGELQLVSYGLSGFPVFQFSSPAIRLFEEGKQIRITADFLPWLGEDEWKTWWQTAAMAFPQRTVAGLLSGFVPPKVAAAAVTAAGLSKGVTAARIGKEEENLLLHALKRQEFLMTGYNSFDRAQTTSGGVPLSEVSPETMESKICPGLYLAGECLNADGRCGGYNLQWAFSTGFLAGQAAAR